MSLHLLPKELLPQIIEYSIPEGFEGLVLCCRDIWASATKYLESHNRLRKRYRNFQYDAVHGRFGNAEDFCSSSVQLLLDIAENPMIARYIVRGNFINDFTPDDDGRKAALVTRVHKSEKLMQLLKNSIYLQEAGIDPSMVLKSMNLDGSHGHSHVREAYTAIILLTLLPNIAEISLPIGWFFAMENAPIFEKLLSCIVKRANNQYIQSAGLSNLTSVLPSRAWCSRTSSNLSSFLPFMRIHSVRHFKAGSCQEISEGAIHTGLELPWAYGSGKNIESVELAGAFFKPRGLQSFLSWLPKLRTLKFSYEENRNWFQNSGPHAAELMHAIELGCGERLENLSFSLHSDKSDTFIKCMKDFHKLKQLELDIEVLPTPIQLRFGVPGDAGKFGPRLGDILPLSIARVCLVVGDTGDHANDLKNLLAEISAGDNSKLPNLKEVVIRTWALEEWDHPEKEPNEALQKVIGLPIRDLGLIPEGSTEETERNNFFLPLDSEANRTFKNAP